MSTLHEQEMSDTLYTISQIFNHRGYPMDQIASAESFGLFESHRGQ